MSSVLVHVRSWWRDRVVGPKLPTYDRACEELGGVPWRPKPEATDRWFIADVHALTRSGSLPVLDYAPAALPAGDTASFVLKKPISDATKMSLLGGSALIVIVACLVSLLSGTSASHPTVAASPPVQAEPVLLAAVTPAPSAAPVMTRSSAPRALVAVHAHAGLAKRHVAARHRRR
jgi:hypothetical protein